MSLQALVFGRAGADLYLLQTETPLEQVRTFERFVGGFAGNVATGLAREPSRSATFGDCESRKRARMAGAQPLLPASVLDLDWREAPWNGPGPYRAQIDHAVRFVDGVVQAG